MQCGSIDGKRPYLSPDDLVYAQPVAIKPVGRPIATIPVRGPPRGPPPFIQKPHGPGQFGPGPFGPGQIAGGRPIASVPPRRGYTPQYKPPGAYFSQQSSSAFNSAGSSYESKPLGPIYPSTPIEVDQPYKFEIVNGHNSKPFQAANTQTSLNGLQQHVHHHFHHGDNAGVNIQGSLNPVSSSQIGSAAVAGIHALGQTSAYAPGNYQSASSVYGNGLGTYVSNVKPVVENHSPQTFDTTGSSFINSGNKYGSNSFEASVGQYGNASPFYKKEFDLNSQLSANNFVNGQASYANKYQSFQTGTPGNYDCVCVPYDQCPAQHVIGRKDDLYLPLDPRNLKTDILAEDDSANNSTEEVKRVEKSANSTEEKKVSKRDTREVELEHNGNSTNVEPVSIIYTR